MTQIGHTTDFPLRLMPQKIYTLAKEQKTLSRDGRGEGSKVQTVGRVQRWRWESWRKDDRVVSWRWCSYHSWRRLGMGGKTISCNNTLFTFLRLWKVIHKLCDLRDGGSDSTLAKRRKSFYENLSIFIIDYGFQTSELDLGQCFLSRRVMVSQLIRPYRLYASWDNVDFA